MGAVSLIVIVILVFCPAVVIRAQNDDIANVLLSDDQLETLGFIDEAVQQEAEEDLEDVIRPMPQETEEELRGRKNKKNKKKKKSSNFLIDPKKPIIGLAGLDAAKVAEFNLASTKTCTGDTVNRCGDVCHCISGKHYCCRQRKDWDDLTNRQKKTLLKTIFRIAVGNRGAKLRLKYRQLLQKHERYWFSSIHSRQVITTFNLKDFS